MESRVFRQMSDYDRHGWETTVQLYQARFLSFVQRQMAALDRREAVRQQQKHRAVSESLIK